MTTLWFSPGRSGDLIARAEDGKIVLPARGERVEEGPYVAAALRPTASGRAYIAHGLQPGKWSKGDLDLGLPEHAHPDGCAVCAQAEAERMQTPCALCGQPLGREWRLALDDTRHPRGSCRACSQAARISWIRAVMPQVLGWRDRVLAAPLPEIPAAPEATGRRVSEWRLLDIVIGPDVASADGWGRRSSSYSVWEADYSCGHDHARATKTSTGASNWLAHCHDEGEAPSAVLPAACGSRWPSERAVCPAVRGAGIRGLV